MGPPPVIKPEWKTPQVLTLARAAYEGERGRKCLACNQWTDCKWCKNTRRIEDGSLDPLTLLALADALEEAGCGDLGLLRHLRGEEACWHCAVNLGAAGRGREGDWICPDCRGAGWLPRRAPCVRGCAVVDALTGRN